MAKQNKPGAKRGDVSVRLLAPYRFHDDDGNVHHWHAGQPVSGDDAHLLIERGAPVEEMQ